MQYRQGDVFVEAIRGVPRSARTVPCEADEVILVAGEATGHNHVVPKSGTRLLEASGPLALWVLVVDAPAGVPLTHPEHATILIPPGVYQVKRQREYSPIDIRYVMD